MPDIGPRTTSMRSMSARVSTPKLYSPPGSAGSFIGMPSRSTSVWLELVPRVKALALAPRPPDCARRSPGTADNASANVL